MMPPFSSEPAVYIAGAGAVLEAVLLAAIAFGLPVTPDQKLALGGLGTCLITVLTGIYTRSQVTPVVKTPTFPEPPPIVAGPFGAGTPPLPPNP